LFLPFFSPFQLVIHSGYNTNQNALLKGIRVDEEDERQSQPLALLKKISISRLQNNYGF
jgi:hypothetical protein